MVTYVLYIQYGAGVNNQPKTYCAQGLNFCALHHRQGKHKNT